MRLRGRNGSFRENMNKFVFANQLRGIAAILVVMTHYFGVYFGAQPLVAALTFSPNFHFSPAPWVHYFELPYQGPLGVALFFLISGFVIPFSLQQLSLPGFLLRRGFRIFPTYLACLGVGLLAIYVGARLWGLEFTHSPGALLANATLTHNLLGIASIDEVNWTLAIEIKFYLIAAALSGAIFRKSVSWLLIFLALVPLCTWIVGVVPSPPQFFALVRGATGGVMDLNYIIFMMVGIVFHQHVSGLISRNELFARAALILAVFSFNWSIGPQRAQFPSVTINYYCAVLIFAASYFARGFFKPFKILDFFASISYPLYCVHALLGYSLLKMLMHRQIGFGVAVLIVLPCVTLLAFAIHKKIETTSDRFGRRWTEKLFLLKAPAASPVESALPGGK